MRLNKLEKLVQQLVAGGGGGGGGFLPDWGNQVEIDPSTYDSSGNSGVGVFEAAVEGPRLVRVNFGVVIASNTGAVQIFMRQTTVASGGVESDMDVRSLSGPYDGEIVVDGVIGDGTPVLLQANKLGNAAQVSYLAPTRITDIPAL